MASRTEKEDPETRALDTLPTDQALELMNKGDVRAAKAVSKSIGTVASLVDAAAARMRTGGRLIYVGAGTSGRVGVMDASEIPPTFGIETGTVLGIIAGGEAALTSAVEGLEDDRSAGAEALDSIGVSSADTVIGLTASGNTQFTVGALDSARSGGCLTACVTSDPEGEIVGFADFPVVVDTGPEFIAGSTRLRAGTAQKLVLNMISTMVMVRLGYTSGNRMTNLTPGNRKLVERARRIVASETGLSEDEASELIARCGGDHRVALVVHHTGASPDEALSALTKTRFIVSAAVSRIGAEEGT